MSRVRSEDGGPWRRVGRRATEAAGGKAVDRGGQWVKGVERGAAGGVGTTNISRVRSEGGGPWRRVGRRVNEAAGGKAGDRGGQWVKGVERGAGGGVGTTKMLDERGGMGWG